MAKLSTKGKFIVVLTYLLSFLGGFVVIFFSLEGFFRTKVMKDSEIVKAEIISYSTIHSSDSDDGCRYEFKFKVDGKEYNVKQETDDLDLDTGDKVKVFYKKDKPTYAKIYRNQLFVALFGCIFIVVPFIFIFNKDKVTYSKALLENDNNGISDGQETFEGMSERMRKRIDQMHRGR